MFSSTLFYITKRKKLLVDPLMHDWKNSVIDIFVKGLNGFSESGLIN